MRDIYTLNDAEFAIALSGMESRKAGKRQVDNPHATPVGARAWLDGWKLQAEIDEEEARSRPSNPWDEPATDHARNWS